MSPRNTIYWNINSLSKKKYVFNKNIYYYNNNINIEDFLRGTTYNCKYIFSILIIIQLLYTYPKVFLCIFMKI